MNYQEAMEFIDRTASYGSVLGLSSIRQLLKCLGNPQERLKFIHIAGTNGKGSVLAYVSTVLTKAGFRTGRYLSPVIFEYREKIQIDGEYITEEEVAKGMTAIKEAVDQMLGMGFAHPTVFEIETALGFLYFVKKSCDLVVLETGLGGQEDATNVITTSICSVITSVSLDHVPILGETIEEIAACKAGIIKPFVPVVLAYQAEPVMEVVRKRCMEKNSVLRVTHPETVRLCRDREGIQRFSYKNYKNLDISLAGRFQIENACIAIEVIEELRRQEYQITQEALKEGLLKTNWPGRFQKIHDKPLIYVDGAHNPEGAKRLYEAIELYFTNQKIIYIIGVLKDKDYKKVIDVTINRGECAYTITPENERGLPGEKLAEYIRKVNKDAQAFPSLWEAFRQALRKAGEDGVIIAFGSLSFLGEFMNLVQERQQW